MHELVGVSRMIEIRFSRKFGGSWTASEGPGVEPAFPGPNGKSDAISYARGRFGGSPNGEIHVYDEDGDTLAEVIKVKGSSTFGN